MGLIGNILQPLYVGFLSILLSPVTFIQEPAAWLRAITEFRATTTGAPNFAWDYCVKKVNVAEKDGLDLSSLKVAYNGAEPVRADTLDRFSTAFAQCRFRTDSFFPCYGVAESTLFVSGGPPGRTIVLSSVCSTNLQKHILTPATACQTEKTRLLVGSGQLAPGVRVEIVNPETSMRSKRHEIGEIWLASDSVAPVTGTVPRIPGSIFKQR